MDVVCANVWGTHNFSQHNGDSIHVVSHSASEYYQHGAFSKGDLCDNGCQSVVRVPAGTSDQQDHPHSQFPVRTSSLMFVLQGLSVAGRKPLPSSVVDKILQLVV